MSEAVALPNAARALGPVHVSGDARLARLAAVGDQRAFAAIFERYHQPLYRYCRSIVGNDEDAQDALQNTMAKVLQALPGEEREVALKPWLYRIAHNEAIELVRRRRPHVDLEGIEASAPGVEEESAVRERLRQLTSDLSNLPERQRGALVMRELSGLSYSEIAKAFATSPAVAKQAVYEARVALQEQAEGREMDCRSVRASISERDGRILRGRRLRAHLRGCDGCRSFRDGIGARRADFAVLAPPLPAVAAATMFHSLVGGASQGGGAGVAGVLGGGAGKTAVAGSAAAKLAVAGALVVGVGAGTLRATHLAGGGSGASDSAQGVTVTPTAKQVSPGQATRGSTPAGTGHSSASQSQNGSAGHSGSAGKSDGSGKAGSGSANEDAASDSGTGSIGAESGYTGPSAGAGNSDSAPGHSGTLPPQSNGNGNGYGLSHSTGHPTGPPVSPPGLTGGHPPHPVHPVTPPTGDLPSVHGPPAGHGPPVVGGGT
jgi:RNA polymerase sigma factor (sigma-70 family)